MLKVKKLKATLVHGYIPINLTFYNDLTFLTGSNGCGKTTALKLIAAILQPNFEVLSQIQFDTVELICWHYNKTISVKLISQWNERSMHWEISEKGRKKKEIIESKECNGEFKLYPIRRDFDYSFEEYKNIKENIFREFVASDFFKIIDSYGNPVLLGIDRKIGSKLIDARRFTRKITSDILEETSNLSFFDAQNVILDYVSSNADKKKTLVEELKANIFKSLFKYVKYQDVKQGYNFMTSAELKRKKEITISAVSRLDIGSEILNEINEYFNNIQVLQENLRKDNRTNEILNEWWANRPHLKRIESISEYADDYQKKIDALDFPLNEITKIANDFFSESNKRLSIGANGRLNVTWENNKITTRNLSSGEMQLIVILIHLVFCEHEKEHSVFVIDEPELSLHISWQEKFVDAITKASPRTQFILATHSPAIISKLEFENKCIYMQNA